MKEYKPKLMSILKTGNKHELMAVLNEYKEPNGAVCFEKVLAIESAGRLPMLAKTDYAEVFASITAGLTLSFEAMNLTRSINDNQIIELTQTVLDTSNEDNLSLEDLMLFLQKLTRGEYGKLYESMDIPKFMEFFEKYREERFQALREIQYGQSVQHKALPINDRLIEMFPDEEKGKHREALMDYLKSHSK